MNPLWFVRDRLIGMITKFRDIAIVFIFVLISVSVF